MKELEVQQHRVGVPVPRDSRGRIMKGYTPNPSGRRKGVGGVARLILDSTRDGAELVEWALRVWRNQKPARNPDGSPVLDENGDVVLVRGDYSHAEQTVAHQWLSDRGLGRPVVAVDMQAMVATVDVADTIEAVARGLAELDDAAVLELDGVLERLLGPGAGEP